MGVPLAAGHHERDVTGVPAFRRDGGAYVVGNDCLALRYRTRAASSDAGTAYACTTEPHLAYPILVPETVVEQARADTEDVPHLSLLLLHERAHVIAAERATASSPFAPTPLGCLTDEAVAASLDLAAEFWLRHGHAPSRRALVKAAPTSLYPTLVHGLLTRLSGERIDFGGLAALAVSALEARTELGVVDALNGVSVRTRSLRAWRRAFAA